MDQKSSNRNNQDSNIRGKGLDEKICESCGEIIKIKAEICPKCGVRHKGRLSKTALLLITFFFGGFGGHKFYTGRNWQGFFYLILFWTGIPGLIALIEFIIYAFTSSEKLQEKYSASSGGLVIVAVGIGFMFMIGILAAIAIPNFIAYRNRSYQVFVQFELNNLLVSELDYFDKYNNYSNNLKDLNFGPVMSGVTVEIISADEKCFEAKGMHSELQESMSIDCNGLIVSN